jgi:tetratricopeptide (TPR) repeat protein
MMLRPSSLNEPYKPYIITRSGRSAVPDDFSDQDLDFFLIILPSINKPEIKARLSDLIWLKKRSKVELALDAIDAYIESPITLESFSGEGGYSWIRAIQLARVLRHAAGDRMKNIKEQLLKAFRKASEDEGFLAKWIADVLKGFGLGVGYENEIAEKLVSLAEAFKLQGDFYRVREYYESSSYWFEKADKELESFKSIAYQAEAWHTEAAMKETASDFIGSSNALEKAIQVYRSIPNKHRTSVGMEEGKLQQMQSHLGKVGKLAAESKTLVSTPRVDITDMVSESRMLVRGKPVLEALKTVANFYPGAKKVKVRAAAEEILSQFHFGSFFGFTVRSRDGRIVAKNPGIAIAPKGSDEYEQAVWKEMLQTYYLDICAAVAGRTIPALETMLMEHRLQLRDFESICRESSIVPPERAMAFAKALFYGYDLDFDSAIHRLVPQVENMVRYHLKASGAPTTVLDKDGTEAEINLGALLDKSEALLVFGEDLVFEMQAMFCESRGPNFRHHLAHGLLEDRDFETAFAVYAWCLALRLVFNVFWNSQRKE